jgi:hypothetical protein
MGECARPAVPRSLQSFGKKKATLVLRQIIIKFAAIKSSHLQRDTPSVSLTPEQLAEWRTEEFAKIHKQAVKLAGFTTDKYLCKQGIERADLVRVYEVLSRNDLGVRMSQKLLEGMDIRGLDLRKVRGLHQQQIDLAIGDHTTLLPDYLQVPQTWMR